MIEETLKKFGYPNNLVKDYQNWLLLCRFEQVTLGSLILICKEQVDAFSKISPESFSELSKIIPEVEQKLKGLFNYDKINYLMLMMIDPEVHFHIIPRYAGQRNFEGSAFTDVKHPLPPDFKNPNRISPEVMAKLTEKLKEIFAF